MNNESVKYLLVGPRVGETATGVSVAFETLLRGIRQTGALRFVVVDLTQNSTTTRAGAASFLRAAYVLLQVLRAWWHTLFCRRVYLIVASSRLGFCRDFLIINFAWLLQRKIVVHLHGGGFTPFYESASPLLRRMIDWTYAHVSTYIVLSESLRTQFSAFAADKIQVVENGLAEDAEPASDPQKQFPQPADTWHILYLSNLMESKGYWELALAGKLLVSAGFRNFQIHFCGSFVHSSTESTVQQSEQRRAQFMELITTPEWADFFVYHDKVGGADKRKMLTQGHLFVLPTTYPGEGQPLSIIEAMANGMPVISTRHAAIPEMVSDGKTGLLLDRPDPECISQAIQRVVEAGPGAYQDMSEQAIIEYKKTYSSEAHLGKMIDLLGKS